MESLNLKKSEELNTSQEKIKKYSQSKLNSNKQVNILDDDYKKSFKIISPKITKKILKIEQKEEVNEEEISKQKREELISKLQNINNKEPKKGKNCFKLNYF